MRTFTIEGKNVSVYPCEQPGAPIVYLNTFAEEGQQIWRELCQNQSTSFSLVSVTDLDWNHDMVPWDAPPLFKKAPPCTGGADAYLHLLTHTILPAVEAELPGPPCWRGLAGYSLAGLFALYAMYQTDAFSRFASMSGSLWFPGLQEYLFTHHVKRPPDCLYFSLGDKECKTRNLVLQTVQENTQNIQRYYQSHGICTTFHLHPGNHYSHAAERTAAGIRWLLAHP